MKQKYGLFRRQRKRGSVWYFWYWKDNKRISKSSGQRTKWEAKVFVEQYLKETDQGIRPNITLSEYAQDFFVWNRCPWIRRQHAKGRSFSISVAKSRRSHLKNYLFPQFGSLRLASMNPVELENWLISLSLENQTKNHILYTLNIILREAKREKVIPTNPLVDVEALGVNHKRRDILTPEELQVLFPQDMDRFRKIWPIPYHGILYALKVSSGMRSGEIRAAPWAAIIWEYSGILILRAFSDDGVIILPKGKSSTPQRQRAVILPERTMNLLRWWQKETRYKDPQDFIFPGRGGPLSRRTVSIQLVPGLKRAGINLEGRYIVAHSLRHTYNTRMKELLTGEIFEEFTGQGLLREFTGHKSKEMTEYYDNPIWLSRLQSFGKAKPQIEQFWRKEDESNIRGTDS